MCKCSSVILLCLMVILFTPEVKPQNINKKNGKSTYTFEEIKKMCGLRIDQITVKKAIMKQDSMYKAYIIEKRSSYKKKLTTPPNWQWAVGDVENQHTDPESCRQICWAYATRALIEGYLNTNIMLDEQELVTALSGCQGGYVEPALNYVLSNRMASKFDFLFIRKKIYFPISGYMFFVLFLLGGQYRLLLPRYN